MTEQIFLSHSSKDIKIVEFFKNKFDDTCIKPVLMEYEKWSRNKKSNGLWIIEEIQKSKAIFIIITKNIIKIEHTQNWVSFEIGVAATCDPKIPVIVFKEQDIDFPIPYLTHYFNESLSNQDLSNQKKTKDISQMLLDELLNCSLNAFFESVIKDTAKILQDDPDTQCPACLLKFHYIGGEEKFNCPCCSKIITRSGI